MLWYIFCQWRVDAFIQKLEKENAKPFVRRSMKRVRRLEVRKLSWENASRVAESRYAVD
jgi:hypothetical protein